MLILSILRSLNSHVEVVVGTSQSLYIVQIIPGGVTIIPILVVLILAFWTKEVMISLLFGVFLCATFINNYNPIVGFERTLDTYMVGAIADSGHAAIILFSFWIAALIALVQKSGGAAGLAIAVTKGATNRWRAQWLAYALGVS